MRGNPFFEFAIKLWIASALRFSQWQENKFYRVEFMDCFAKPSNDTIEKFIYKARKKEMINNLKFLKIEFNSLKFLSGYFEI